MSMRGKNNPRTRTKEQIQEFANKCKTRSEFYQRFGGMYQQARKRGWLDEVCAHMELAHKSWNVEKLKESAAPYEYRNDWRKADPSAYLRACRMEVLDEVCAHMKKPLAQKKVRDASSGEILTSLDKALRGARRARAISWRFVNGAKRDTDRVDLTADWTMQTYDQFAYENEDRVMNYIEILRDRGDDDAVDAAWQLFTQHMDGNWCTAAG
jgi:hypothetical protein